jgi:hypothetical protein
MKVKKVIIKAYYNLGEEFLLFPDNSLHGKSYENVSVVIKNKIREICGISYESDIIEIEGEEPIECQLLDAVDIEGLLLLKICQDWG